jgi:hypothetical protein
MLNCIIVAKVSDSNHSKSNFSCSIVLSSPKFLTTITARISETSNRIKKEDLGAAAHLVLLYHQSSSISCIIFDLFHMLQKLLPGIDPLIQQIVSFFPHTLEAL